MKSIKFNESELEFLQNHYELELSDAENYVGEIKNILKKLGVIGKEIAKEKPVKSTGKKPGRPKKDKKTPADNAIPAPSRQTKKVTPKKVVKRKVKPAKKTKLTGVKAEKTSVAKAAPKKKVRKVKKVKKSRIKADKNSALKAQVSKPVSKKVVKKAVKVAIPPPAPLPVEAIKPE